MKSIITCISLSLVLFLFSSCSDTEKDSIFPSVMREFCLLHTDSNGAVCELVTDDGLRYNVTNVVGGNYSVDSYFRVIANYNLLDEKTINVFSCIPAFLLTESTVESVSSDPIGVVSVTRTAYFINLHLLPKIQDEDKHTWGYMVVDEESNSHTLRLLHLQNADPASYSEDYYCCIQLNKIPNFKAGDVVKLVVNTWSGEQTWELK